METRPIKFTIHADAQEIKLYDQSLIFLLADITHGFHNK